MVSSRSIITKCMYSRSSIYSRGSARGISKNPLVVAHNSCCTNRYGNTGSASRRAAEDSADNVSEKGDKDVICVRSNPKRLSQAALQILCAVLQSEIVSNLCLSWRPRHLCFGERESSECFLSLIHLKMGSKPKAGCTHLAPAETEPRPFTPGT